MKLTLLYGPTPKCSKCKNVHLFIKDGLLLTYNCPNCHSVYIIEKEKPKK